MKKLLSIILAVVMIASLLPATFMTAAAAEQTDLSYVFAHKAHFSSANNGPEADDAVYDPANKIDTRRATDFSSVSIEDTDTSVSSGRWGNKGHREDVQGKAGEQYNAFSASLAVHRSGDFVNYVFNPATVNSSDGFFNWDSALTASSGGSIVIITIEVPVSGTYIPALNAGGVAGQKHELFLVKETEENKDLSAQQIRGTLEVSDRLGAYDASVGGEQKFLEHYLEEGIYYLCLVPSGKGANSAETLTGQTGMSLRSFHLYAPEKKPTYDPSKLGGDGKLEYKFDRQAINSANKVVDSETGETTWYFADSEANIQAYYKAVGNETQAAVAHTSPLDTWTDQSEDAKAAGKYLPWSTTTSKADNVWLRPGINVYMYPGFTPSFKNSYDIINTKYTDKWTYVSYSGSVDVNQIYTWSAGLHNQLKATALEPLGSGEVYTALKINVPTAAKYDLSITITGGKKQGAAIYLVPATETLPTTYAGRKDYLITKGKVGSGALTGTFNALTAGDYYLIWEHYNTEEGIDVTSVTDSDLQTLTLTALGDPEYPAEEVSPELAAKRAAMVLDEGNPDKETIADFEATVNVLARETSEDGDEIISDATPNGLICEPIVKIAGQEVSVEAPEIPGYTFRYWGTGLGTKMRPVTTEATATIKAAKGATYLSAFYSRNDAEETVVEFYNANRELVDRTLYAEGDEIEIPELPSLTGVGTSTGWTMDGGKTEIGTDADIKAEGKIMAFFAVYDEEAITEDIEITAKGSTGITGEGTYAFGDVVTLKAPARENGNGYNMFLYWKKNGEIVSFDREYTFNAAVDCEVEAVYAKYGPTSVEALRKIIVSTVGEAVVAEFIGCENALERGFIFGDLRQPMKTDATSFTMINDTTSVAKAYAIFTDGVIYSK